MQKLILLLIFCCTCTLLTAQRSKKTLKKIIPIQVLKLEGITFSGDHVLGIYSSRAEALATASNFQKEQGTKNRLTYKNIKAVTIDSEYGENTFAEFKKLFPKGYILLSPEEYNTLQILKKDNREAALWYYMKTKQTPKENAVKKLNELAVNYTKYL